MRSSSGVAASVWRCRYSAVMPRCRCCLLGEGGDVPGHALEGVLVDATDVEREADPLRDRVDQTGMHLDLTDGADRALAGRARQPLELEDALGHDEAGVEPEVHRRRAGVVAAPVDGDVGVDVAGDRGHDPDPVAGVLEHPGLLDVHLDPAGEVVEHVDRLAPALGLVARLVRVLPEAPPVVDRQELLLQLLLGDALKHDPTAEHHLAEARALLLEERDKLQWEAEPSSSFSLQTSSAVTTPIVPS